MKTYTALSIFTLMTMVSLSAISNTSDTINNGNIIKATEATEADRVSLYNVGNGTLIYSYSSTPNSYISADYAYKLKGKWADNSNWDVIYVGNGNMLFQNVYSRLCLQYYGNGYQVIENACNINDRDQQIKAVLSSTGAIRLQFDGRAGCLYSYAGDNNFYIYSDICRVDKEYLWVLIPQLRDATN
jgi:hypothetical protein